MFEIERRTGKNLEQLYEVLEAGNLDVDKLLEVFVVTDRRCRWKLYMGFNDLYGEVIDRLPVPGSQTREKVHFLLAAVLSEEQGAYIFGYPMEELYPVLYEFTPKYERMAEVFNQSENGEQDDVWHSNKYDGETRTFLKICGRIQVDGSLGDDKKAEAFLENRDLTEEMIKEALEDGWRLARITKEKLSKEEYPYDERNIVRGAVLARHLYRKRERMRQLGLRYGKEYAKVLRDINKLTPEGNYRFLENNEAEHYFENDAGDYCSPPRIEVWSNDKKWLFELWQDKLVVRLNGDMVSQMTYFEFASGRKRLPEDIGMDCGINLGVLESAMFSLGASDIPDEWRTINSIRYGENGKCRSLTKEEKKRIAELWRRMEEPRLKKAPAECPRCGHYVVAGNNFCGFCGSNVRYSKKVIKQIKAEIQRWYEISGIGDDPEPSQVVSAAVKQNRSEMGRSTAFSILHDLSIIDPYLHYTVMKMLSYRDDWNGGGYTGTY